MSLPPSVQPHLADQEGILWQGSPYATAPPAVNHELSSSVVGVLGLVCIVLVFVIYYKLLSKYCTDCDVGLPRSRSRVVFREDCLPVASHGLCESVIRLIPVSKFMSNDEQFESKECAVCLSAFEEGDALRLLPSCNHGFHIPCIDSWLQSHASCPLCRTKIVDLERCFAPAMAPPFAFPEDRVHIPIFMRFEQESFVDLDESSGELQWATLDSNSSSHQYWSKDGVDEGFETQEAAHDEESNACATEFFPRSASVNAERSGVCALDTLESGLRSGSPIDVTRRRAIADTSPRRHCRVSRSLRRTLSSSSTILSSIRKASNRSGRWTSASISDRTATPGRGELNDRWSESSSAMNSGKLRAPNSTEGEMLHRPVQEPWLEANKGPAAEDARKTFSAPRNQSIGMFRCSSRGIIFATTVQV